MFDRHQRPPSFAGAVLSLCSGFPATASGRRLRELLTRLVLSAFLAAAQPAVDTIGSVATLANRPHNERCSTMRITGGKNSPHGGAMRAIGRNIPPTVQLNGEIRQQPALHRTRETHRQQYQIRFQLEGGTR